MAYEKGFIADVMVGRLARWMRILGFDVLYFHDAEDDFIIYAAKEDRRTIITRDRELAEKAKAIGLDVVFINGNSIKEQLKEIVEKLSLTPKAFTRCAVCNGKLLEVEKAEVEGIVPEFVYFKHNKFWKCGRCGRVYWSGSHVVNMVKYLGFDPWKVWNEGYTE